MNALTTFCLLAILTATVHANPRFGGRRKGKNAYFRPQVHHKNGGYDETPGYGPVGPKKDRAYVPAEPQKDPGYVQTPDDRRGGPKKDPKYGRNPGYGIASYRPKKEPGYGTPSYRPKNEPGYGTPSYRPKNEPGYGTPSYRPKNEPGYGTPSYRPKNEPGYDITAGYGSTKNPGYDITPGYGSTKDPGYDIAPGYGSKKDPGYDSTPGYGSTKDRAYGFTPGYEPRKKLGRNPGYGPVGPGKGLGYGPFRPYKPPFSGLRGGYKKPGYGRYDEPRQGYGPTKFSFPFKFGKKDLDELDKIYFRLDNALVQIKFLSEMIDALAARLSLQTKFLAEFKVVTVAALKETDERQDNLIEKLWSLLGGLGTDIEDLGTHVDDLFTMDRQNIRDQEKAEFLYAKQRRFDVKQDRYIGRLTAKVNDFKRKLFQVSANYFETFKDTVELATVRLGSIKARENRRMCETGRVTLKSDDRRIEASYQTWFDKAPQIVYGICGYSIDLDASDYKGYDYRNRYGYKNWHNTYDNGYGYGYYYNTPEAIGLRALAYTTKSAFIVEGVQLSFGESQAITADICYQACTIDPGVGPVVHP